MNLPKIEERVNALKQTMNSINHHVLRAFVGKPSKNWEAIKEKYQSFLEEIDTLEDVLQALVDGGYSVELSVSKAEPPSKEIGACLKVLEELNASEILEALEEPAAAENEEEIDLTAIKGLLQRLRFLPFSINEGA